MEKKHFIKNKKIVTFILVSNLMISLFSYEWENKIETFSYDLYNRSDNTYSYILKEYFDTIYHKNRDYLLQVIPSFINTGFADLANDKFSEWYELLQIKDIAIGEEDDKQLLVFDGPYFIIEEIEEIQTNFIKLQTQIPKYSRQFFDTDVLNWKKIKESEDEFVFLLKFDGDYIYVYENDISNLFAVFCKISSSDLGIFRKAVKTNNLNNLNITWPRHADGTCDYDDEIKPPKVQLSDNDSVAEEEEEDTYTDSLPKTDVPVVAGDEITSPASLNREAIDLTLLIPIAAGATLLIVLIVIVVVVVRKNKRQ